MIGNVLRIFRNCKTNKNIQKDSTLKKNIQGLIR